MSERNRTISMSAIRSGKFREGARGILRLFHKESVPVVQVDAMSGLHHTVVRPRPLTISPDWGVINTFLVGTHVWILAVFAPNGDAARTKSVDIVTYGDCGLAIMPSASVDALGFELIPSFSPHLLSNGVIVCDARHGYSNVLDR